MKAIYKKDNKIYEVYDIKYNSVGYPHFLIYKNGEWICESAKYFKPYYYADKSKGCPICGAPMFHDTYLGVMGCTECGWQSEKTRKGM